MTSSLGSDKENGRTHLILEHPMMDESTQQLIEALEERFGLQLKPIEARQQEILDELKSRRDEVHTLQTQTALSQDRIKRYEQDLNRGLSTIRKDLADGIKELEEKIKSRNKVLAPAFAALASITALLLGIFVYWLRS